VSATLKYRPNPAGDIRFVRDLTDISVEDGREGRMCAGFVPISDRNIGVTTRGQTLTP
jgi:hypothetical protein